MCVLKANRSSPWSSIVGVPSGVTGDVLSGFPNGCEIGLPSELIESSDLIERA